MRTTRRHDADLFRAPRRAWLVNPFDAVPGERHPMRYEGHARALAGAGWQVTWFTADYDHVERRRRVPPGVERVQADHGIRIEYVHVPSYAGTFGARRVHSHHRYVRGVAERMAALAAEAPRVIVASVPLTGALRAALAFRRVHGGAVVADIQDLWPEALASLLPGAVRPAFGPLRAALVRRETGVVRACDGVMAVSDTYLTRRSTPGQPRLRAYLGVDVDAFDRATRALGTGRRPGTALRVLWAGTIRPTADLATVVEAAAIVRQRRVRARFVIAGDGPGRAVLETHATRLGVGRDVVAFTGPYRAEGFARLALESDVGLNAYVAATTSGVTSELVAYQAAGLAVINSLPGEVAELVVGQGMGLCYVAGDPRGLAAAVERLAAEPARVAAMGAAARRFAEQHGSRRAIAARVVEFLEGLDVPVDGRRAAG